MITKIIIFDNNDNNNKITYCYFFQTDKNGGKISAYAWLNLLLFYSTSIFNNEIRKIDTHFDLFFSFFHLKQKVFITIC